jgi:hypothetical protein
MNSTIVLAFYVTPAIVIALGVLAYFDHQRFMRREAAKSSTQNRQP